ncbi:hypothetical protein [Devosia sp. LC5]|nr:hypothetical protein [Devosia sp. LC5]
MTDISPLSVGVVEDGWGFPQSSFPAVCIIIVSAPFAVASAGPQSPAK